MKIINWVMIIGIIFVIALGFAFLNKKSTGNAIKEDVFEGKITNMNLEPGLLDGEGVYDRTCQPVENGLTQCDAGIQTEKGLLNFEYKHNMHLQGCIDAGQKLKVEVLADGMARVIRL